jgi:uncharacterized membrane protein
MKDLLLVLTRFLGKRDTKIVVLILIGVAIGTLIDRSILF